MQQEAVNGGKECSGVSIQEKECNAHGYPVDCKWGKWTTWGSCTETCCGGTEVTTSVIKQEALNGGIECSGGSTQEKKCNTNGCPVDCK